MLVSTRFINTGICTSNPAGFTDFVFFFCSIYGVLHAVA